MDHNNNQSTKLKSDNNNNTHNTTPSDLLNYEKAADYLKQSISINKQYSPALVSMGNLLFETGHS